MANPIAAIAGPEMGCEFFKGLTRVPDERRVNFHVLVDFGAVDLNVDLASALGVSAQVAGDAVVKTHANGNQEVGFLNGVVHPRLAVFSISTARSNST